MRIESPDDQASPSAFFPHLLSDGWQCLTTPAGMCPTPAALREYSDGWLAAPVPGTVASAWRQAGKLNMDALPAFAFEDHWYRLVLSEKGHRTLRMHGLATLSEVWLDDARLLDSDSMFIEHDLGLNLSGHATLYLCFRSLSPALAAKRSRARWRPRLAQPATLRNVRTTLLGHMPGWCPPVQAAGPWRPVELLGNSATSLDRVRLHTSLDGDDGLIHLTVTFIRAQRGETARLVCKNESITLDWRDAQTLAGTLRIRNAPRWWPHTHGDPALHQVLLAFDETLFDLGRIGFREITENRGPASDGFQLAVNGVDVFARGACWTHADLISLGASREAMRPLFALARDAGMNMLRVGGTMLYESDEFYELADEYGILVWQDFAFANFDYPTDPAFTANVQREAEQFLSRTQRFASLAVLCGGSEADQQGAMLGLPSALREQKLFTQQLPSIVAALRPDVPYVVNSPSAPAGNDCADCAWPFATRAGITHYYGVGAYQRPLEDVRRANVRFASECLAFANVPDDVALNVVPHASKPHEPRWKAAVPRDPGAGWDFDDVREHYLRTLYGVDPARLRYEDSERYLDLSRAVVADLMIDVFSEWRRSGSSCAGGIVWQMQDLRPGAGWGVIDALGAPKSALHGLAQVFRSVVALITDEGLDGLDLHLINETAAPVDAQLELVCLRDGATSVVNVSRNVTLGARSTVRVCASEMLGQFFDFTYAYRFGPRAHDATVVTLRNRGSGEIISEAFHFPDRTMAERYDLGLAVRVERRESGEWELIASTQRLARWVHVVDTHYRAALDWFHLPPGVERRIPLVARHRDTSNAPEGEIRSLNATFSIQYQAPRPALSAKTS